MDLLTWARNQWDRIAAWVIVTIGGFCLVLGWIGVTSTPYSFEQIPYVISGGLGGIFLLGVEAMLWISADLRDEWRKLDELVQIEQAAHQKASTLDPPSAGGTAPPPVAVGGAPTRRAGTKRMSAP